jgi:hypothetical protein
MLFFSSFNDRPTIQYTVEAERFRTFSRLEMANSADANKKTVSGTMQLYKQTNPGKKCVKEVAYLKVV